MPLPLDVQSPQSWSRGGANGKDLGALCAASRAGRVVDRRFRAGGGRRQIGFRDRLCRELVGCQLAVLGLTILALRLRRAGGRAAVAVLGLFFKAYRTAAGVGVVAVGGPIAPDVRMLRCKILPRKDRQGLPGSGQILTFGVPGVASGALVTVVLFQQLQHGAVGKFLGCFGLRFF